MLHTIEDNVAHSISPIFLLLGISFVAPQLSSEMPQYGIALGQDSPIQLNNGDVGRRVHLCDASILVVRVFVEAVTCVIIGDAGIFPHETNNLAAASGQEIEVMNVGTAANGFVADAYGAVVLGCRHFECVVGFLWAGRAEAKQREAQWLDLRERKDYTPPIIRCIPFPLPHATYNPWPRMM